MGPARPILCPTRCLEWANESIVFSSSVPLRAAATVASTESSGAVMRRLFSHSAGTSPAPKHVSEVYRRGFVKVDDRLPKISSWRALTPAHPAGTSAAHVQVQGRSSLNPSQKFNLDSVYSKHQSYPVKRSAARVEPIDLAHITEVLASKNCFFLLNHDRSIKSSNDNPHLVVRILQNQDDALLSLKFYIWASSINRSIASNRSARTALANVLVKKGPVILSAELLREVDRAGCRITEDLFCILIGSWGRLGLAKYCADVFFQMSFLGIKPSTRVYNAVIDALVKSNSLDMAYFKFQQMAGDHCFPDRFTYNILMHGVSKVGIVDEALRLMKQMESSGYLANVFTFSILIDGFCNASRVEEAFQVLDTMRKRNVTPTGATYRTLVHGTFRCMELCAAYTRLVEFVDSDPVLQEDVCCTALYCLSKNGMAREANEFLRKLRRRGYFPDNSTFNIVMAGLLTGFDVGEARQVMDDFIAAGGKPGFTVYVGLIAKLCKEGSKDESDRYVDQMISEGLVHNVVSFNMLIDCFSKVGMMDRASNIFEGMVQKGVNPNLVTFNSLINGYCKIGEVNEARNLLKGLLERGLTPDVITFCSIIDGLCRAHQTEDGFNCFFEMIEWGVVPNDVTYNTLIRSLSTIGEIGKAMKLFKKMRSDGIDPDIYTFNSLILSLCKIKMMKSAQNLLDYMVRLGATPDIYTYNALIKGLCNTNRVDEALELLLAMNANGCTPNNHSYASIIEALLHGGRSQEAHELVRECKRNAIDVCSITNLR